MDYICDIKTRNELADFLDIPRKKLTYILYVKGVDNLYKSFDIPKKNGDNRHINAPTKDLKNIQKKLADALTAYERKIWEEKQINPNISHAFEKDKSFITNAKVHRNKKFVFNIDLENFFESFHFGRIVGYFNKNHNFSLQKEVATVIAQLSCYKGNLPQGSPCSPIITNLICNIFDMRLLKLAKKYKMDYTRYADDITFSTNNNKFLDFKANFYNDLLKEIKNAGFKINENKTRIQYRNSRQEVTGVIVNKKLNVRREYYKNTRAMAYQLYKTGEFFIEKDIKGTINQLEGRFSFINQLESYNNKLDSITTKHNFEVLSTKEKTYSQFIFYKYFFANNNPLIVTEGKTDIVYLKAALKNLYKEYPDLINKKENGEFEYKVSFLNRTNRLSHFLNLRENGADSMNNIYKFFSDKGGKKYPNYIKLFKEISKKDPKNPVILLFDNELQNNQKPIYNFVKDKLSIEEKSYFNSNLWIKLKSNLYLSMTPLIEDQEESEIEDLFKKETLSHKINEKKFSKENNYDKSKFYGKEIFSKYILNNYNRIDFSNFKPLLNNIKKICENYKN